MVDIGELEKTLQCSICHDLFNEPVTLFCNHTYCHSCLVVLKKDYRDCRQCPVCQTKIWEPSLKTVNYVIRDTVKQLFGEERYQANYQKRQKILVKEDIRHQVAGEIKDEMWRSIVDILHINQPRETNKNPLVAELMGINTTVCPKYNSIHGCKNEECVMKHVADATKLMDQIKQLRRKFGYLFTDELVCAEYNTIKGCPLGEACEHRHVPHVGTLMKEITRHRDRSYILDRDDAILYLIGSVVIGMCIVIFVRDFVSKS